MIFKFQNTKFNSLIIFVILNFLFFREQGEKKSWQISCGKFHVGYLMPHAILYHRYTNLVRQ